MKEFLYLMEPLNITIDKIGRADAERNYFDNVLPVIRVRPFNFVSEHNTILSDIPATQ